MQESMIGRGASKPSYDLPGLPYQLKLSKTAPPTLPACESASRRHLTIYRPKITDQRCDDVGQARAVRRGGHGFSDEGVSGFLPVQYSNWRAEIHEETKT
jgi:hypothetical protein